MEPACTDIIVVSATGLLLISRKQLLLP
jgi:hypothetical protein